MPPVLAKDRVYTTELVASQELVHIDEDANGKKRPQRRYQAGSGAWRDTLRSELTGINGG